ncbi:MAG: ACT domain-containing protein [Rubrobacter sp.]
MERLETRETVAGIVHDYDVARITLNAIKTGPGTLSKVFTPLAERGISVDIIVESGAGGGAADIAFTVKKSDFDETLRITNEVAATLDGEAEGEKDLGKVSVVGTGMLNRPGYAARMFATLGEAGIPIRLASTSEIQVTCVIASDRVEEAVRNLHRAFELEDVSQAATAGNEGDSNV